MRYHDFDLWIDNRTEGGYPLRACCEPHGEARDISSLDADSGPIREMRTRLAREETDSGLLTEFGSLLYSALFAGKDGNVDALFQRCCGDFLGNENEGIRIRLRIEAPKLATLPWEFLYSRRTDCFLGTCIETPLVRYLELAQRIRELKVRLPLRMLVAAPEGSGLDTKTETSNLSKALEGLEKQVQVTLLEREVTRTAIGDALLEERFHLFHFIGHGEFQNDLPFLLLNDGRGGLEAIDHQQFGGFFLNHPSMKLVLLNSCKGAEASSTEPFVGMASQLVQRGVPAVIAMQYAIGDDQAILFAREFYRAIFRGWGKGRVEMAVSLARNSLLREFPGDRVVGTPVLFTRAAEGVLFDPVTGNPLKDAPYRASEADTTAAVIRTREKNIEILENEPEQGEDVTESLRRESAELRSLKLRLRLGKAAIFAAIFLAPFLFSLFWLGILEKLPPGLKMESYTVWLVERRAEKTFSDRIALIPMNARTADRFGRPLLKANWRRDHARLVDRLSRAGAKVIAFDMSFPERKDFDEEFSQAIRDAEGRGTAVVVGVNDADQPLAPTLAGAVRHRGFLCIGKIQGSADIAPLLVEKVSEAERPAVPSLALAAVAAHRGWTIDGLDPKTVSVRVRDGTNSSQPIRGWRLDRLARAPQDCAFFGAGDLVANKIIDFTPPEVLRAPQRRLPYEDALRLDDAQATASVNGKIVVVGVEVVGERFDIRRGPGEKVERFGYELHADAMSTLLRGASIRPLGDLSQFLIIFGLSLFGGLLWAWHPDRRLARWALLLAVAVLSVMAAILSYSRYRVLLNTFFPLIALVLSYWVLGRLRRKALR